MESAPLFWSLMTLSQTDSLFSLIKLNFRLVSRIVNEITKVVFICAVYTHAIAVALQFLSFCKIFVNWFQFLFFLCVVLRLEDWIKNAQDELERLNVNGFPVLDDCFYSSDEKHDGWWNMFHLLLSRLDEVHFHIFLSKQRNFISFLFISGEIASFWTESPSTSKNNLMHKEEKVSVSLENRVEDTKSVFSTGSTIAPEV